MTNGSDAPSPWLVAQLHHLSSHGVALDVACGRGRNALWLAERGLTVVAVDRDADAVAALADQARRRGLRITARVADLEAPDWTPGAAPFDVIAVFNYLHRPLLPRLVGALRPGGVLVYETFTQAQALVGRPRNPDFLLGPGELRRLTAPLAVLDEREGEYEGRWIASIAARKGACYTEVECTPT